MSAIRMETSGRLLASSFAKCPRFSFSGHQTFPFRYAWLPKGVAAVREDSRVFRCQDAIARLGVGKNMVASIRFWCEALGLIVLNRGRASLTSLGSFLFGSQVTENIIFRGTWPAQRLPTPVSSSGWPPAGADPFLEDPGTLWLLHWQLASRPTPASTWFLALTWWPEPRFTRDELTRWLLQAAAENQPRRIPCSPHVMRRDVDVFLRTYVPSSDNDGRRLLEDTFDCPLTDLGLVRHVGAGYFSLPRGPRPSLPTAVLVHALGDYWRRAADGQETLSLERALYDPGSPGAAFRLGDRDLVAMLERLPPDTGYRYDETAGQRLVLRNPGLAGGSRVQFPALLSYYSTRSS